MLRAAFVCPCYGIGGADGFMVSLMNNTQHIEWVGVGVRDPILAEQYRKPSTIPIHQAIDVEFDSPRLKHVNYHKTILDAQIAATKNADVVITWCMDDLVRLARHLNNSVPIIDFAQNEDKHAKNCVQANEPYIHHRAACSQAAASVFGNKDVKIIYNSVDPNRVTPRYGRDKIRSMWGLENEKIVTFMGRLVSEKNPEALVQALQHLPTEWKALFCGGGTPEAVKKLHDAAARYAPGRCLFLEPQQQVGDVLAASDVYCLPSDFEGLPLATLEAWFAGVPTVLSDFTVVKELIELYGQTSVYVNKRPTGVELAQAILLADSPEFIPTTNKMRNVMWNDFTISTIAAQWEEYLYEVVDTFRFHKRHIKVKSIQGLQPYEC